ncbi:glycine-rich cell wall structural protein 1-like [Prunus dulcis]|uniref:glycine-rich cell wall structural protein 1-like n=1 Tax=Prunus dulcis TaxID=3755 RepID=UPI001482927F|nr:glycine-rich cell wall structural protein 1-like [Prunus dulcis]XP_034218805.1 glycine-rich cell wall structural protein 1-like [Prunus dulcis]
MSNPKVIDKQLNGVLEFGDGQVRLRTMCESLYQLVFEVNAEFGELGFHASDIVRNFVLERMKLFCKAGHGLGHHGREQTQTKVKEGSDYQLIDVGGGDGDGSGDGNAVAMVVCGGGSGGGGGGGSGGGDGSEVVEEVGVDSGGGSGRGGGKGGGGGGAGGGGGDGGDSKVMQNAYY